MKKFILGAGFFVGIFFLWWFLSSADREERSALSFLPEEKVGERKEASNSSAVVAQPVESAVVPVEAANNNTLLVPEPERPALQERNLYYPGAKTVSSYRVDKNASEYEVNRIVDTEGRIPYVRIVDSYTLDKNGRPQLTGQVAMVANQALVHRPATFPEATFQEVLRGAGAEEIRSLGNRNYRASFQADPQDPKALENFLARVKQLSSGKLEPEPNYIRKLI